MRHVAALLLLIAAAPEAPAQPPTPEARSPDAETMAAAMDLFEPEQLKQLTMEAGLRAANAALDVERKAQEARGQAIPDELFAKIKAHVFEDTRQLFEEMAPTMHAEMAAIYAKYFTAAELREFKRVRNNPVMRKMERMGPAMMAEMATVAMKRASVGEAERKLRMQHMIEQWLAEEKARKGEKPST